MSFLSSFVSGLKKVGSAINVGLKVAQQEAPIINALPYGTVASSLINEIFAIEAQFPQTGQGSAKETLVTTKISAQYPNVSPTAIKSAISAIIPALNALEAAATPPPTS